MKGNDIDMTVGIIIGGPFGKTVPPYIFGANMPPIGLLIRGIIFSDLAITLKETADTTSADTGASRL